MCVSDYWMHFFTIFAFGMRWMEFHNYKHQKYSLSHGISNHKIEKSNVFDAPTGCPIPWQYSDQHIKLPLKQKKKNIRFSL